ncbi:hypothetical protein HanXRQr2_Chr02g0062051 [Helianthus annuus]|uniref:Uncharacterized protein n=1 Tax=Helianthus annuus TaxID=4232 RepID=A0A9K3JMY8_HELAN|nr:hypothetical protein HanXRQr2_Chr02g0062051 [Helianthus annuus]
MGSTRLTRLWKDPELEVLANYQTQKVSSRRTGFRPEISIVNLSSEIFPAVMDPKSG